MKNKVFCFRPKEDVLLLMEMIKNHLGIKSAKVVELLIEAAVSKLGLDDILNYYDAVFKSNKEDGRKNNGGSKKKECS